MFAYVSVCEQEKPHIQTSSECLCKVCMLSDVAVTRGSVVGGVAIDLIVLRMTSCSHVMGPMAAKHYRSSLAAVSCMG